MKHRISPFFRKFLAFVCVLAVLLPAVSVLAETAPSEGAKDSESPDFFVPPVKRRECSKLAWNEEKSHAGPSWRPLPFCC